MKNSDFAYMLTFPSKEKAMTRSKRKSVRYMFFRDFSEGKKNSEGRWKRIQKVYVEIGYINLQTDEKRKKMGIFLDLYKFLTMIKTWMKEKEHIREMLLKGVENDRKKSKKRVC